MGLNDTPSANRVHIGFFGRRNAGKSSLVNAVTGQELAVVSDTKGTTTDPVYKSMELLPLGPVVMIDTPGCDDEGKLGAMRVKRARQVLNKTDIAVMVIDAAEGMTPDDEEILDLIRAKEIPYILVYNKTDIAAKKTLPEGALAVSAESGEGVNELKEALGALTGDRSKEPKLIGDLLDPMDMVVLVTPIDESAPKGRIILPQQQTIRDILDTGAIAIVTKETELKHTLESLSAPPAMVVTDSQVFSQVAADTPEEIPLTSFSILMARYKGFLDTAVRGVRAIDSLKDGDTVLVAEGCTHHRQCNDIGTVKIPRWLGEYTKKDIRIESVSGTEFPDDLSRYALVIHCGGCMLNEREMRYRMKTTVDSGTAFTNYGITIAYMKGILQRSLGVFPDLARLFRVDK